MADTSIPRRLLEEVLIFVDPLRQAATTPTGAEELLASIDWQLPIDAATSEVITALEAIIGAAEQLRTFLGDEEKELNFSDIESALTNAKNVFDGMQALPQAFSLPNVPGLDQIPLELIDALITRYIVLKAPGLLQWLMVAGLVELKEIQEVEAGGNIVRVHMFVPRIAWPVLGRLVSDPVATLKELWLPNDLATADDVNTVMARIGPPLVQGLESLGAVARIGVGESMVALLPEAQQRLSGVITAMWPMDLAGDTEEIWIGFTAQVLSQAGDGPGVFAMPIGAIALDQPLGTSWRLVLGASADLPGVAIRPTKNPVVEFSDIADSRIAISAKLERSAAAAALLGSATGTHFRLGSPSVAVELAFDQRDFEFGIEAAIQRAAVVLQAGDADSFLGKILGGKPNEIPIDLLIGFSRSRGLYFAGSASLEIVLPIKIDLGGVIGIDGCKLRVRVTTDNPAAPIKAQVGLNVWASLGPVYALVENIGVELTMAFPADGAGNLGPANVKLGFKPPNGLGLRVDATSVKGGGYLFFDFDEEEYAGIAQLKILDFLDIKIIGLLTTRVPGLPPGQKGFSLLLIVAAEFNPITLAYGFTLNGVGGLIGINRTMMLEPLRAGVKNKALDSILFPKDPVSRALQIISDLRTIFPPRQDRFVIGPMVKIGWGASIITLELGIIIEIPSPIRLAILGTLSLALPTPEEAVVSINMDILGTIDFGRSEASLDATIYDSRILLFALSGDMAMRLGWGESPTFLLSIGGFHPRFQTPQNFPTLDRLALSLATGENPRLRLEIYMAVTSNTFQMGARLDVFFNVDIAIVGSLTALAYLGFDTLFQFNPFHFIAEIYGGVDIRRGKTSLLSADLRLTLDGPGPFRAVGTATINFLGKHEFAFEATTGEPSPPEQLPVSRPMELLRTAIGDVRNWSVKPPEGVSLPVALREQTASSDLVIHPFGGLAIRQTVLPLNTAIDKFGETTPDYGGPFVIEKVALKREAPAPEKVAQRPSRFVKEDFAPGQFFAMTDEQKLSRPAFESRDAGVEMTWPQFAGNADAYEVGASIGADWDYDTVEIDVKDRVRTSEPTSVASIAPADAAQWLARSAGRQAALADKGWQRYGSHDLKVAVREAAYAMVNTTTGAQTQPAGFDTGNYTDAAAAQQAGGAGTKVVGAHEVAANG